MEKVVVLDYNTFVQKFAPRMEDNSNGFVLYETYGEDLNELKKFKTQNIWTLIDDNEGHMFLQNNIHWVNRLAYVVCDNEWDNEKLYEVPLYEE